MSLLLLFGSEGGAPAGDPRLIALRPKAHVPPHRRHFPGRTMRPMHPARSTAVERAPVVHGRTRPPVTFRRRHFARASSRLRLPLYQAGAFTPTTPSYGGVSGTAAVAGTGPRWRVRIVGQDYRGKAELVSAAGLEWTERLNDFDEVRFTFSMQDPGIAEFRTLTRWIEVWLDGALKFRGFPVRANVSLTDHTVQVQCFDQLWPFHRRVFGRADRRDYVTNGGFESGTTGWSAHGGATLSQELVTPINAGSASGKISGGGYINQFFTVRHTYPPGLVFRIAFDVYVPSSADGVGQDGTACQVLATDPRTGAIYTSSVTVNDDLRDGWQSLTVDILLASHNIDWLIELRLNGATTGSVWFDRVRAVFNDATTVPFPGADQAIAYRNVVQYGQGSSEGKSHLGIATDCPATGVTIYPAWVHADHRGLMSAIDELTERTDGPDWSLVYAPEVTTFTTHYPQKGDTHNEWLLEVGRNIAGGSVEIDGSQTTTSAIVLGDAGDFERDEGGYVDASPLGGLILEDVIRADINTAVRFLDGIAEEHVDQRKQLAAIPKVSIMDTDREMIHDLEVGDIVPVRLDLGLTQVDGRANYRVVAKRVPQSADRLQLDLVPVPT